MQSIIGKCTSRHLFLYGRLPILFFLALRNDEFDVDIAGFAGGTIRLCDNQGVLTLGKLSQKSISDPDLRGILANAELDANKMKPFEECDKLLLITSVIYSERFELIGERMHQVKIESVDPCRKWNIVNVIRN